MKIAFDITSAVKPERTGIANSILNLVKAISEIDRENDYYLCCRLSRLKHYHYLPHIDKNNFYLKIIQEPFNLFFPRQIDIFHSGGTRLPRYKIAKTIVTIPDVLLLLSDEYASREYRQKKLKRYYESAQKATRINTISNFSKREIVEHLKVPEEKIDTIHLGIDERYYPQSDKEVQRMRDKYRLIKDYILYVGIITKRKNVLRILKAFHLSAREMKNDCELVMAGKFSWGKEEFFKTMDDLSLRQKVKLLGYVPDEDLPALYTGAKIFFFPSLYEGFGIPVLEAMACGTPVITSNLSSLPEVAGDAALLVDPYDAEALASALVKLIEDENLCDDLRQKGFMQVKNFSWKKAVQEMLEVYNRLNLQ
jgi:glycosyltransferase involved in cell wall biosynthesis